MTNEAGIYIIVAALWLAAMIQLGRWALRVRLEVIDNKRKIRAAMEATGENKRNAPRGNFKRNLDLGEERHFPAGTSRVGLPTYEGKDK